MKKTWRILLFILVPLLLITACCGKADEVPVTSENVQMNSEVQNQKEKSAVEQEEYQIISVHADNYPYTNLDGGIGKGFYVQYISFCYSKENEVVFTTLALDKNEQRDSFKYEVHCSIGEENKVKIITQHRQYSDYKTYYVSLKLETYHSIYN